VAQETKAQRQAAARRAKAEAHRQAQRRAARRRRMLWWGAAALAVVVVAAVVVALVARPQAQASGGSDDTSGSALDLAKQVLPAAVTGSATPQQATKTVTDDSGIDGVLAWDTTGWPGDGSAHAGALQHDHVTGPVDYRITPPVGGPHNAVWMNAGVYTKPVPTERAVHNLEHGAVWITYRPGLAQSDVDKLVGFVGRQSLIAEDDDAVAGQSNRYVDLSPWSDDTLPAPIVISAWGHQLRLSSPDDPRLQKFVDTFRHSKTYTPEYGEAVDGVPVETGGVPAAYGSSKPNPAGRVDG
jgi:hypothetical protein